jgi:hypothetical protein
VNSIAFKIGWKPINENQTSTMQSNTQHD